MVPYQTVRTPQEQAVYWRQSRSRQEIAAAIDMLRLSGAPFLADVLHSVGPQHGDEVTHALPGNSWHQWGEAVDCFWEVDGKAEWSTTRLVAGLNGYRVYADEAASLGLDAGLDWESLTDAPHVQLQKASSPLKAGLSWADIDMAMKERFGGGSLLAAGAFHPEAADAAPDALRLSFVDAAGWRVFESTDKPAALFRAKMAVDADGAPKAYHSDDALALDKLVNAGRPGNWWGLVVDGNGEPIVQGSADPAPGYYISQTALVNPGVDPKTPARYVDSETIPYIVLPKGKYAKFTGSKHIRLGDVGVAYNIDTERHSFAVFADIGPANKLGEGSIALAKVLGVNPDPKGGGTKLPRIVYAVFPGSGKGRGLTVAEIRTLAEPLFEAWGGLARIAAYSTL